MDYMNTRSRHQEKMLGALKEFCASKFVHLFQASLSDSFLHYQDIADEKRVEAGFSTGYPENSLPYYELCSTVSEIFMLLGLGVNINFFLDEKPKSSVE